MLHLDIKYLNLISPHLEGFTQKKRDLWNFRCPYCGDSHKKKTKKRGFIYKKGNGLFYKCFNCDVSTTFYKFLEYVDPSLAKEYSLERYFEGGSKFGNYTKPEFNFSKPKFKSRVDTDISLPTISSLPETHFAKKYVLDRKIPKGSHKHLYFSDDFKQFVLSVKPDYEKTLIDNDPRLIIPFRDESGKLLFLQGRALNSNPLRYITIRINENSLKLFGLDRVNKKERIFVTEGPIDSLFLKNAVATADANLAVAEFLGKDKIVLVNDNEPRNIHIVKQIKKYIDNGFNICLFPEFVKFKDINEMVLGGMSKPQIQRIIEENTFSGMRAELEFNKWKKV